MPLYEAFCPRCGKTDTYYASVENRSKTPKHCGTAMKKMITAAAVRGDIQPFQSPIDGRPINSRQQWKEDLKRNGCRPWEGLDAEKQHADSCLKSEEAKSDKKLESAVATTLSHMSSDKQKVLKNGFA